MPLNYGSTQAGFGAALQSIGKSIGGYYDDRKEKEQLALQRALTERQMTLQEQQAERQRQQLDLQRQEFEANRSSQTKQDYLRGLDLMPEGIRVSQAVAEQGQQILGPQSEAFFRPETFEAQRPIPDFEGPMPSEQGTRFTGTMPASLRATLGREASDTAIAQQRLAESQRWHDMLKSGYDVRNAIADARADAATQSAENQRTAFEQRMRQQEISNRLGLLQVLISMADKGLGGDATALRTEAAALQRELTGPKRSGIF